MTNLRNNPADYFPFRADGAWLGIMQFKHKTKKPLFRYSVLVFIGTHLLLVLWKIWVQFQEWLNPYVA